MTVLRVFPRRVPGFTPSDALAFVGDPPMFRPEADRVDVSVTFSWDIAEGRRLAAAWAQYYPFVVIAGPAIASYGGDAFEPGLYVQEGKVFTSRGCNRRCPWCLVPEREGQLRELPVIAEGWNILDNNFAACTTGHRTRVYQMLARQPHGAIFSGGIDARLVDGELEAEFRDIRILDVFLAADTLSALGPLEQAISRLQFLGRERLRCYVLIGFGGETIEQADSRLRAVWELGAMPFAMLYQPPTARRIRWPADWRALQRTWTRPAAMKAEMRSR